MLSDRGVSDPSIRQTETGFVTTFGVEYRQLPCGHYIKVGQHTASTDDPPANGKASDFCYHLCHEDRG